MGGGKPKNKQNNSSKTTPSKRVLLSGTESGGAPGGESSANVCIISFETTLDVSSITNPPTPGDVLFFVPSETANTFNVWFGAAELGTYSGPNVSLMWRCANDGYEYHGNVISVESEGDRLRLLCKVETFSRE